MGRSLQGPEGSWHQKRLGLLRTACPCMRPLQPCPPGVPSVPLHTPRSQGTRGPCPPSLAPTPHPPWGARNLTGGL